MEERLAACINILPPCQSIYWWEGKVQQAEEVPAILKTSTAAADRLIARIAELHSYDVPAIVALPVERLFSAYGKWVEQQASN